ncbi:hypothetical protein ABPG72_011372 [Tetrahymena utriculariae]
MIQQLRFGVKGNKNTIRDMKILILNSTGWRFLLKTQKQLKMIQLELTELPNFQIQLMKNLQDKSISLSEQQLIDCSRDYENYGCSAGQNEQALVYIQRHSITTEQNYPYTEKDIKKCQFDKIKDIPNFNISDIKVLKASTNDFVEALKTQPVDVSVDATYWKYYKGGVFCDCKAYYHKHDLLLVGFQNGTWLIKNSYRTNWGESGYIRLKNGNTCGVANQPYQPFI